MKAPLTVFERLVDDAAMFTPGNAEVADAVAAHRQHRGSWYGFLIGPLVVSDHKLAEVGRAARAGDGLEAGQAEGSVPPTLEPIGVSVVNTSGAGGLSSLAGRRVDGIQVVSVESALRDLDDLAGNAARVVAAAAELDDEVHVFVEIPYAPGWQRAVAVVEEAGFYGKLRTGGDESGATDADQLAQQLSVLVEADLPFKATARPHQASASDDTDPARGAQHGFLNLMVAVEALVEGASVPEAAELLRRTDRCALAEQVGAWSEAQAARVRRRLRSFGCSGVLDPVNDLVSLGLLVAP